MAVQRRVNWISQQRVDVPDMRSVESAASNDFDQLVQGFVTGTSQGYVIRGFEILMSGAIGGAASGLQVSVDPGAIFHIASSQSGTVFMVPSGTPPQQLNGATNTNVVGAFAPSSINYVGIEYTRFIDPTTDAQVYIWDPTSNSETTLTAPRAQILTYQLIITTSTWASNVLPLAIVTTDAGNNVTAITDARWLLMRLGQGGASPNPFYTYPWTAQSAGRTENPSTSSNNSVNPFEGGDKMLFSLKDWMNALMSSIKEIKGTTYWYQLGSAGSISSLREDLGNTVVTGNSTISHGILPNSTPVLVTTGNTHTSNVLDSLASTVGIVPGQLIIGSGIPAGTVVLSLSGSTVTMSQAATSTSTGISVSFYAAEQITAAGQVNWASNPPGDGQLYFKVVGSRLSYQIQENPTGNSVTLADNQVAYLSLTRGIPVVPNLVFTPNSGPNTTTVTSVGSISWTSSLQAGDWVRAAADTDAFYYKIQSVDSLSQVTLKEQYIIAGMTPAGVKAAYAFGVYTLPGVSGNSRDIAIANREAVPMGADITWLFLRSDDLGSTPRVYVKFMGAELQQGDSQEISGPQLNNVLQYIGSPIESAVAPQYTSAVYPGAVPEIISITTGAASTMASNQYFFMNSPSRQYYVWVKKDGVGTDPAPLAGHTGIEWDITTGQSSTQTAVQLVNALNATFFNDFRATYVANVLTVTNNSAGVTSSPSNFNVGAPFAVSVTQTGTGPGNWAVNDGDNLTLAIKKLDDALASIIANANNPNYDEAMLVVSGSPSGSNQVGGPVSPGTNITLPDNSREGSIQQLYTVGKGNLVVYLNGQALNVSVGTSSPVVLISYAMGGGVTSDVGLLSPVQIYAVKYTPSSNASLNSIKFILATASGSPSGNLQGVVYNDSAGTPSTLAGSGDLVSAASITSSPAAFTLTFTSPVSLVAGTPYWFGITGDGTYFGGANHVALQSPNPSGGQPYPFDDYNGSVWTSLGNDTPCFELDATSSGITYDWTEVGAANTNSSQIQINRTLVIGDLLSFRIVLGGGGGGGGGGGIGPQGPPGPAGPAGHDAAGGPVAISTKTSNYTVSLSDNVLLANATGGAITFQLPAASSATGHVFYFKKIDSSGNAMTVLRAGSDLIDGATSQTTSVQYSSFVLITDGTNWYIF